jgi:hypothetical protein
MNSLNVLHDFKAIQKVYGTSCSDSVECKQSFNLECSTSAGQCVCPNNYAVNSCDCPMTKYYDSTFGCRNLTF